MSVICTSLLESLLQLVCVLLFWGNVYVMFEI